MQNTRFPYSPIAARKPWKLPDGARVALWVVPNIEHFHIDKGGAAIDHYTAKLMPDILNYSWRDYGVRVGIWRLMEIMQKHGVRGTVALNAEACDHYPEIIAAGNDLEWEWMGHGNTNSKLFTNLEEDEERGLIELALGKIEEGTGHRPRGWLSPALSETFNTPDLLAEAGVEYVCNWVNDDQPYRMRLRDETKRLYSIPYSIEINDIPAFLELHRSPREFYEMIVDQFEVLYREGAQSGRVMAISLHPFIMGQPFRAKYLDLALEHITGHDRVWVATGGEIVDWYKQTQE
jgi:peptidoglycan/xylan/chitin deacetylase (PgdA/CDA1 family)